MTTAAIAVSIGEPAGIGPDIILAAWADRSANQLPPFFVIGDPEFLRSRAEQIGIDIHIVPVSRDKPLSEKSEALCVLPLEGSFRAQAAKPDPADARLVLDAIAQGTQMVLGGEASAIVTCPINKGVLYGAGFHHPGHTEYLADLCKQRTEVDYLPVMMLAGPQLRTVPVTIHIPLSEVPTRLTSELIVKTCRIVAADLSARFGLSSPRLAISGLNPHAGEQGSMGTEDQAIIQPAIEALKSVGIDAVGPLPADTMFHKRARETYDVAICMYHDQALIPAKTLAFDEAVNVTLGLPIIRTSPDHGTAFDLAGTGKANPSSFVSALKLAAQMAEYERLGGVKRS